MSTVLPPRHGPSTPGPVGSSAGLRSFLGQGKRIKAAGGTLVLAGLKEMVREVFNISGFATLFPIHLSLENALDDTI